MYSRGGEIVVEEFMEGPEVSVETLAVDGDVNVIQITDKVTTGAPYFVEMGHSQPSRLSEETRKRIVEVTIAANKAIGIKNGPSHTEIKITQKRTQNCRSLVPRFRWGLYYFASGSVIYRCEHG